MTDQGSWWIAGGAILAGTFSTPLTASAALSPPTAPPASQAAPLQKPADLHPAAPSSPAVQPSGERSDVEQRLRTLEQIVREQQIRLESDERALAGQARLIADQRSALDRQNQELIAVKAGNTALADLRATGSPAPSNGQTTAGAPVIGLLAQSTPATTGPSITPVGQAPPPPSPKPATNLAAALPENSGVLTPAHHWVVEPSVAYSRSSSNVLVFEGVEIVPGINFGVIEANTAARNSLIATAAVRYGLTSRSELELRVPYVYRSDRETTVQTAGGLASNIFHLHGSDIGDVEFIGRYQLNAGGGGWPIFVANLRAKSDTGSSPYEVPRDQNGVALALATGSGFWGVEPSVSMLYVTDPAVLFANLSYLHQFPKDINKTFSTTTIGKVWPGDSIGASVGFGFALNPQFSFSLGYRHSYIFRTYTDLTSGGQVGTSHQGSDAIVVGSLLFGASFSPTPKTTINAQWEFGVTSDAPNVTMTLRTPISF